MDLPGGIGHILEVGIADGKFQFADLVKGMDGFRGRPGSLNHGSAVFGEKTVIMVLFVGLTLYMAEYACNQKSCNGMPPHRARVKRAKAMLICCISSLASGTFFRFLGNSMYVFFIRVP
jgi:SSS family solute:Na+ symporter